MSEILHTIAEVRERLAEAAEVAFVPTMGALHEGHLALVGRAGELASTVVVSIFVNPLQFGPNEDLDRYPRDLDRDVALLPRGTIVFAPEAAELYPADAGGTRVVAGPIGSVFEGVSRPGHYDGVLTVVTKLLNIVQPDIAVFGEKDAQQVFLIERLVADLDLPVHLEIVPTVREADGLALSSRNRFLDEGQRSLALTLSRALQAATDAGARGAARAAAIAAARAVFEAEPAVELDYLELVDPATFEPVGEEFTGTARGIVAARVGQTRLIDTKAMDLRAAT